ncbi:hypothetical protein [Streptomyces sp. 3N207]|uniref:hypothetical protein n=1 Tax=Streptomyces sp. 3N207 TaxID=3457417 RepID=UPI003FD10A51
MRKTAQRVTGLLIATAAAISVMGVTAPGAQALDWKCKGTKVSRCIAKAGEFKVFVKFENHTNQKVNGSMGLTLRWLQRPEGLHPA